MTLKCDEPLAFNIAFNFNLRRYDSGWLSNYVTNSELLKKHAVAKTAAVEDAQVAAEVSVKRLTSSSHYLKRND